MLASSVNYSAGDKGEGEAKGRQPGEARAD